MGKNYTYSRFDSKLPKRLLYFLTISLIITLTVFQPAQAQQEITEVDKYLSEIKHSEKTSELQTLVYDVQPTLYVNNGNWVPKGVGSMKVANIGASDLNLLQQDHTELRSVKLLLISFKDEQELRAFRLQPTSLDNMPDLAYVFLSFTFDVAPTENFSGIQGFDGSGITFLYESARPF